MNIRISVSPINSDINSLVLSNKKALIFSLFHDMNTPMWLISSYEWFDNHLTKFLNFKKIVLGQGRADASTPL